MKPGPDPFTLWMIAALIGLLILVILALSSCALSFKGDANVNIQEEETTVGTNQIKKVEVELH